MKALILCAGKGERLRPLTDNLPKPMVPINGKPVLEHILMLCKKYGINEIAINTSYLADKIKEHFGNGEEFGVKIKYSYEPRLLGTSGALNNFRDFFDDTFLVFYGDNFTDINLSEMLFFHRLKKAFATIYLYHEQIVDKETTPGVVIINKYNEIKEIIEKPDKPEELRIASIPKHKKFTNAGIYILDQRILNLIPEGFSDFVKDIFPKIINKEKIYGFQSNCYIREVGQMHRYLQVKKEIESGKVKFINQYNSKLK